MANKLCQELLTTIFTECLANPPDSAPLREACRSGSSTGPRLPSPHGTLASAARVCKSWRDAATKVLYNDPGPSICRYEGLYLPHLIASLRKDPYLQNCVRSLSITASLQAGLWISNYACEGDLFCELLELCPELRAVTVPSFEVACRDRVVAALQSCRSMESFNIRVYLESSRRDPRFAKLIPYDSWKLSLVTDLVAVWPRLKEMTVRHIPDNSYHLIPDIVMKPPKRQPYLLRPHQVALTSLSLRETFIDDQGLFRLLEGSKLRSFSLMSCQGITSSAVTRNGLLHALQIVGPTVQHLSIMTPWLPNSAKTGEPDLVLDQGLAYCTALKTLCVAGYDVTNAFVRMLPNPAILEQLEIMDFELVIPHILFELWPQPQAAQKPNLLFPSLQRLAVWQRNAGVGRARVSNGWFKAAFGRATSPAVQLLMHYGIFLATGWESRLISGSDIDFHAPDLTASIFEESDKLSPV